MDRLLVRTALCALLLFTIPSDLPRALRGTLSTGEAATELVALTIAAAVWVGRKRRPPLRGADVQDAVEMHRFEGCHGRP
ncbi:MAG: hypothetical protein LC797_24030 [Chloroflexi bacterium]|nr:hypothetical protein [Chloroflexota bacterium]